MRRLIQESFDQLKVIGDNNATKLLEDYEEGLAPDTTFTYQLSDEDSLATVESALESLEKATPFLLAFNRQIGKITIINEIKESTNILQIDDQSVNSYHDICNLYKYTENDTIIQYILVAQRENSCIASLVDKND